MEEIKCQNKDADLDSAVADLLSFKQIKKCVMNLSKNITILMS